MTSMHIYFTGFNGFGQLKNIPKVVTSLTELQLESLTAAKKIIIKCLWNYCAYVNGSDLYICGCPNGKYVQEQRFPFEYAIKDVACTERFCLVLLSIGTVFKIDCETFKVNEINTTIIKCSIDDDDVMGTSKFNAKLQTDQNDEFITHIAAGRSISVVITNKNNVYNIPLKIYTFPAHVKIKKVCCGNEHCLILTSNGDLYAFGSSSRGQLGLGGLESEEEPILIEALAGIKVIDVATGGWHSVAVSAFNDLYVWGWNVNGQIGLPLYETFETIQQNGEKKIERQKCSTVFATPIIIDLPKESGNAVDNSVSENQYHPVAVSAGARHTIIKTDDGSLMLSGWNKYGQLANNRLDDDFDHFHIINKTISAVSEVVCGDWSTFVISID